jgi:N-acetylglutamate synthase-like GNAT family acetyltransferase
MAFKWIAESPPHWDADKQRIVGDAPQGIFENVQRTTGELVAGEWWRVEDEAGVAGYGWMDLTWGDAEILLAVAPDRQGAGVGTFIVDQLEREAARHGLNYLFNVVRASHPDRAGITAWLGKRGFTRAHDDDLLRRPVKRS